VEIHGIGLGILRLLTLEEPLVWALGTLLNGFMALPNLIGLAFLSGTVAKLTADYFSGRKEMSVKDI
jgi:Na+/alanine symporter